MKLKTAWLNLCKRKDYFPAMNILKKRAYAKASHGLAVGSPHWV